MNIFVACEFSGVVRNALRAKGHTAWSCDLLPAEDGSPYHIQGDAIEALLLGENESAPYEPWDMVIAHPPCTYLANSGVRWLYKQDGTRNSVRWIAMEEGVKFFADLWNACADVPRVAFENPVMHWHAAVRLLDLANNFPRPSFIQPWEHGHPETKKTGWYLRGLPALVPSNVVLGEMRKLSVAERSRTHYASPGIYRWKERSRTLTGIANAIAEQWTP